jgi:hypothetical protein
MLRSRHATFVALYFLLPSPLLAEDYPGAGPGTQTCALFTQSYATNPDDTERLYFLWAQGFLTGLNIARAGKLYANLNAKTTSDQKGAIRAYCDAHPFKNYLDAVIALYFSLPGNPYPENSSK